MTMTDCQHRITVLENEIKMRQDEIRTNVKDIIHDVHNYLSCL